MKIYQEGMQANKQGVRVQKDTFVSLNDFSVHVNGIYDTIKEFGILNVQMWDQAMILDEKRFMAIKQSFLTYFKLIGESFICTRLNLYGEATTVWEKVSFFIFKKQKVCTT